MYVCMYDYTQACPHSPFRRLIAARINRLRFDFTRLTFAWVSPGAVWGADPGSGLC